MSSMNDTLIWVAAADVTIVEDGLYLAECRSANRRLTPHYRLLRVEAPYDQIVLVSEYEVKHIAPYTWPPEFTEVEPGVWRSDHTGEMIQRLILLPEEEGHE